MEVFKLEQKIWITTTLSTLIYKKAGDKVLLHSKKMFFNRFPYFTAELLKHENIALTESHKKILKEQLDVSIWFEKGNKNGFILRDIAYNNPERSSVKTAYASVNFL